MQNTYKKGVSYFVLGIVAAQGINAYVQSNTFDSYTPDTFASTMSDRSEQSPYVIEREDIISDESDLQMIETIEAGEILEEEDIVLEAAPETVSKAEIIARNISDQKLLQIYIHNKSKLQWVSVGWVDYDDFVQAWETLSTSYTQKGDAEVLTQKIAFIEIYLRLSGEMQEQKTSLEYEWVETDVFEKNLLSYLDDAGAGDIEYSNGRKLVKMVEIYNAISENEIQRKSDMQKSISTQFGRVLNSL